MDYEKAYKEARERARAGKPIDEVFPELKESEDEIHRKWILEYLYDGLRKADEQFKDHFKAAIDWLEKQKEQQPVKLDDDTEVGIDRALQIVKAAKGNLYGYQSDDGIYECDHAIQTLECILKSGIEQKPAEWSEEDEAIACKLEYILRVNCVSPYIINWALEHLCPQPKQENMIELFHPSPGTYITNAIKEAVERANTSGKRVVLEFNNWHRIVEPGDSEQTLKEKFFERLWKSSEKQMEALKEAVNQLDGGECSDGMYSLLNDLKKL